jgi:hypothetical protein
MNRQIGLLDKAVMELADRATQGIIHELSQSQLGDLDDMLKEYRHRSVSLLQIQTEEKMNSGVHGLDGVQKIAEAHRAVQDMKRVVEAYIAELRGADKARTRGVMAYSADA